MWKQQKNHQNNTMVGIFAIFAAIGFIVITLSLNFSFNQHDIITGNFLTNSTINMTVNVVNAKPVPPELIFPIDLYTFNKVRFAWEESYDINDDPLTYNIQVSETGTFSSLLINVNLNRLTYEMPFDLEYKVYYFRVRAHDGKDYGQFSKVASFGIKPQDTIPNGTNTTTPIEDEYIQEDAIIYPIDSDYDGIYDNIDRCRNTTNNSIVDMSGCACYQKSCDDTNVCSDDYCSNDGATCRHFYNNTRKCGFFTDCPDDKCMYGNYYNYSDDNGICINGMCFENSCLPRIIYESDLCRQPERAENITKKEVIIQEEEYYTYKKELEPIDGDKDKVPDYRDKCSESIVKFVDRYGCNCDQKRCVDLDPETIDLCYRGRCIFAIKDSEEYNQTTNLIEKESQKEKTKFNFTLAVLVIALAALFIAVFFIPPVKKDKEKQKTKETEEKEENQGHLKTIYDEQ